MAKVAFLGLGVMGYPMAGHLKMRGHHDVVVFNRTRKRADGWVAEFGGQPRRPQRPPPGTRTLSSPVSAMTTIFAP